MPQVVPPVMTPFDPDYSLVPEENLRQAARDIERAIQAEDEGFEVRDHDGLVFDTETIRNAIAGRLGRAGLVDELRSQQFAYEDRRGTLSILRGSAYNAATSRQDRNRHALIVTNENNMRWQLYEGVVKANDFRSRALDAVRAIFTEARREVMPAGQPYQDMDGELRLINGERPVN